MNKPPKGNGYRIANSPQLMFQVTATNDAVYKMRVHIAEGSFWVNNQTFVEYAGGYSPLIEAPTNGSKWVLVYIDKLGNAKISNGLVATKTSPTQPVVDRNTLPLAFVYITSATTQITQDMIFPCHSFMQAGGYPQKHNHLENRDANDCHPIQSITGLQEALNDRYTHTEINNILTRKADADGSEEATFTLNKDHTGVPVEYAGIYVNRGSEAKVGLRFNEDSDKWQYTNDGMEWHNIDNDTDMYDYATDREVGMVKLSEMPEDLDNPVAVAINDATYLSIKDKLDAKVINNYYTRDEVEELLGNKVDASSVYNKFDAETIFVTRAEYDNGENSSYTKNQLNEILADKISKKQVYTRIETANLLKENFYNKAEIDNLIATGAGSLNLSNYWTIAETQNAIQQLSAVVYKKDVLDARFDTLNVKFDAKADKTDLVALATKVEQLDKGVGGDLSQYATLAYVTNQLNDKANVTHHHLPSDIMQDDDNRFVSKAQIQEWDDKQDTSAKGQPLGYASLDENGKVPLAQLPAGIGGDGGIITVGTYTELMTITPDAQKMYLVLDASADTTVEHGAATYIYTNNEWIKISEQESIDLVIDWDNIQNKPTFTEFITAGALSAQLDNKLDKDASVLADIHNSNVIGTKTVDENTLLTAGDGAVLAFNATTGKIEYTKLEAATSDVFQLGSYKVNESNATAGNILTFNGSELVYQNPGNKIGSFTLDESDYGADKVLTYSGGNIIYKALPDNLLPIDNTNIADGRVLAFNDTTQKLEYVEQSVGGSGNASSFIKTLTYGDNSCTYRANKENAITNFTIAGGKVDITIDPSADIQTIQIYAAKDSLVVNGSIEVNITRTDGVKENHDDYRGLMPSVTYWQVDSSCQQKTNVSFMDIDNALNFGISSIKPYPYIIKITF